MLVDRAGLPPGRLAALRELVPDHRLLAEVVRWVAARSQERRILDVITQDEYTHDVIVAVEGELHLVYDTT